MMFPKGVGKANTIISFYPVEHKKYYEGLAKELQEKHKNL